MRSPRVRVTVMVTALVITIVGMVVTTIGVNSPVGSSSFGWFAYQPLADEVFVSGFGAGMAPLTLLGASITVVGLVALSFAVGWHLAARPRPA